MAVNWRIANTDESYTWDFTGGARDIQIFPTGDGWITETVTLRVVGDDATIIANINTLDTLADMCEQYGDDTHNTDPIWYYENADGETGKRAQIKSIKVTKAPIANLSPILGKGGMFYILTFVRSAIWESTTTSNIVSGTNYAVGTTLALPAIDGTVAGRISDIYLFDIATGTSDPITTIWGGIKRQETSSTSDFDPIVELELGSRSTSVSLGTDSTNASPAGGSNNIITYATDATDYKMVWCTLDDAFTSTNFSHWAGDYLMLLRCKLSAANATRIHVDTGYKAASHFITGPSRYITHTDWQFVEMGTVKIPPFSRFLTDYALQFFEFQLYAQSMGSSATISADCITLIPAYHNFKMEGITLYDGSVSSVHGYQFVNDELALVNYTDTNTIDVAAQYQPTNWVYPINGGVLVLAGQEATVQKVTDYFSAVLYYIERFRTHGE